ncbi:MAG: TolC family protein [Rickettsiaceae bacterium]|nr:TolC family protein [Rickettsiaceae bacterium]
MRKIFVSWLLTMLSTSASAVTLEQALTSGYTNNEELQIIRTDFLNEIEQFPRALAGFMPRVSANVDSTDSKVKRRSKIPLTPTATDFTTSDNLRYSRSITLEQPLFDGWSSMNSLKAAQFAFRASRGDFYAKEQDSFLKEINVYLDCVEAYEKYGISKVSVRSNKTQLEAMTEKFKLGESTETEVASAREGIATAEANQAVAYANFEASKATFYRFFGIDPVDVKMPDVPVGLPSSLASLTHIATELHPSIDSARHKTSSSKAGENAAKGELLPKVSFRIQGGTTDYLPEKTENGNVNNRSITSTLSVNVPILSKGGTEYSDIRRAKYQTRKAAISLDSVIKQIQSSCKASWAELEAAKMRIDATTQAVNAAEIAYEGMMQEEMLGSKTIVDVLRTEERLNAARQSRVEARKGLVLAAYRIKSLAGELTAKSMNLKVDYFEPEAEFKKVKMKIVGF